MATDGGFASLPPLYLAEREAVAREGDSMLLPETWSRIVLGIAAVAASIRPALAQGGRDEARNTPAQAYVQHQALQHRIIRLASRALEQDPQLAQRWHSLQETLERAVSAVDTAALEQLGHLTDTRDALIAAWEAGDTTRIRRLVDEHHSLPERLRTTRARTLRRKQVLQELAAFRSALLTEMRASDPELEGLLDRMKSLAERLRPATP